MNAVIFPGQGAQYTGMGKEIYDNYPEAKDLFCRIDSIVGFNLSDKCFFASSEELKDTSIQQLAILSTSLASYEVFKKRGPRIKYFSGLSLGEYSCLYAGGVLSLEGVVKLVKLRAYVMQKAAENNPSCMMAVIGLDEETLRTKQDLGFYVANINSPQQIAISLGRDNKDKVKQGLIALGAKAVELEVSGGFHSVFMEPARQEFENTVNSLEFCDAHTPIVSNPTGLAHTKSDEIRSNLVNQLTHTVLWKQCVEFMAGNGVDVFFEVGPSRVLKGLIRKINSQLKVINIENKHNVDELSLRQAKKGVI